jgi:hypothetical protein
MSGQDEHPDIPSFKPAKREERKGGVPAPGLGSSGFPGLARSGVGGLKVRGLPGGATFVERLKSLRKKDFAFIAAGLAVLMMAPVAEHFLVSPEEELGVLKQGFSTPGEGSTLFPDGRSVYESGTGGLSPGSLYGTGTDVITPLNVRDPSALIMTPGAQRSAAMLPTESAAPPVKEQPGGWKDALAQAASAGAKQAIQKSPKLPKPDVRMSGALRGLQAAQGGGGGSYALPALSASRVPNRAAESNSLSRAQAAPGYKGAASRSPMSGGAPESLKAAGARQADIFNKGGSAGGSLDQAAREAIPGGQGSSESGYGRTPEDKSTSNNAKEGEKSLGESLALMRAKMEMQKAIDLKWKKKEWNEFGRRQMIEKMMIESGFKMFEKAIIDPVGKAFSSFFETMLASGASATEGWLCTRADGNVIPYKKSDGYFAVGSNIYKKVGDTAPLADNCRLVTPWPGTTSTGAGTTSPDPNADTSVSNRVDPFKKTRQDIEGLNDPYGKLSTARQKAFEAYSKVPAGQWDEANKNAWKRVLDQVTAGEQQLKQTQENFRKAQDSSSGAQGKVRSVNTKLGTEQGLVKSMTDGSKEAIGDLQKALATGTGQKVALDPQRFNALVQNASNDVRGKGKAEYIGATKAEMAGAETDIGRSKTYLEAAVGPVDEKTGRNTGKEDGTLGKARASADAARVQSESLSNSQSTVRAESGDAVIAILDSYTALNQALEQTDSVKARVQGDYATAKDQVTKSRGAYDATGPALEAVLQAPVDGYEAMRSAWMPVSEHNGRTVVAAEPQDPAREVSKTSLQSNFEKVDGASKRVLGVPAAKPGEKPPAQAPAADKDSVAGLLSAADAKLKTANESMQAVRPRR